MNANMENVMYQARFKIEVTPDLNSKAIDNWYSGEHCYQSPPATLIVRYNKTDLTPGAIKHYS